MTNLLQLIDALSDPANHAGQTVTVHQTHISIVFVTGERAYKLKKPVDFGFVDYSTPERRRTFCEAEVKLNARLTSGIYLGVRSVVPHGDSYRIASPDAADAVDWVVEMQRLDDADNFLHHLHNQSLKESWLKELGRTLARFHGDHRTGDRGHCGSFETVARNAQENFSQSVSQVGATVDAQVFDRARAGTDTALAQLEPIIRARDEAGNTSDTHGDLRLEHVYRIGEQLHVVDCIEFNDELRFADPVADLAFLVMDLRIRWAEDLAQALADAYFAALPGGEELLEFYVAYRSAVRAKVHGMAAMEPELSDTARERAWTKSRAHWLFAGATLAQPRQRPALVLVGGLPGTGKSTLARALSAEGDFEVIDSDHVRKELAGVSANQSMRATRDTGIYTSEWTQRTYEECLRRATSVIQRGGRVAVAATFRQDDWRRRFLQSAHASGVCGVMLECELQRAEVHRRLQLRAEDASDADVQIYEHVAANWDAPTAFVSSRKRSVATVDAHSALASACDGLRAFGVL